MEVASADPAQMNIVVVESSRPSPCPSTPRYDYKVLASYGHVRDLPAKDGSVRPDDDFDMSWEVDAKAIYRLADIVVRGPGRGPRP